MNELSLFSGSGGGLLGTKLLGWRAVGYVERDAYCQAVLQARIRDGFLDPAPIFGDIRQFVAGGWGERYRGLVDVVTAGFPCPVFSQAARGRNVADDLWPETAECLRQIRPRYALLENVEAIRHRGRGFDRVLGDLAELGFDAEWGVFSAGASGAPHRRPRVWVLASDPDRDGESVVPVDAEVAGMPRVAWPDRPGELRVGDGLAHRVDRLGCAGRGQVPAVVVRAWRELYGRTRKEPR